MYNNSKIKEWLINLSLVYDENKDYLTKLDADIGDADHGINISRGFGFVREALNKDDNSAISAIFKQTSILLIKNVGGASGPLYGTFFLNASMVSANKEELTLTDITEIFNKGINAITVLGKSKEGEKTMLDTLCPALNTMKENIDNIEDFKNKVLISAENGMKSTIDMIATKGRASYLGERSKGHQDPGASSSFMMIKELIKIL